MSTDRVEQLHDEWQHLNLRDAYAVSVFLDKVMAELRGDVEIDFPGLGRATASRVGGRVEIAEATMRDLAHHFRIGYVPAPEVRRDLPPPPPPPPKRIIREDAPGRGLLTGFLQRWK